jgi:phosphoribosyl 1,2-cyclic phosphodiesterase
MIKITPFYSGSAGNLYSVENEETKILLECGVSKTDLIKVLSKNGKTIRSFKACLISHAHHDHSQSIEYVNQYIPIYANERVFQKYPFKGTIIENKSVFTIGTIKILPIRVEHGEMLNTAFIFKDKDSTIFWGTDFSNIPLDKVNFKFNEVWIECNYVPSLLNETLEEARKNEDFSAIKYERQLTTHMSLDNLIYILNNKFNNINYNKIVGIHVSQDVGDYEIMYNTLKKEFPEKEIILLKPNGGAYRGNV